MLNVAQTILQQLGNRKFITMTGCQNFQGDANSLSFKLPHTIAGLTHVRITLDGKDTYRMEFISINMRRKNYHRIDLVRSDVYADQLQTIFTDTTGLYTSL